MEIKMIIVCQSIPEIFDLVTRQLDGREGVLVVHGASEVLRAAQAASDRDERIVVVTSNVFHEPKHLGVRGGDVARRVKEIDPRAWVFLYSTLAWYQRGIDGAVPKPDPVKNQSLIGFVDARPDQMDSLEALKQRLPDVTVF